MKKLSEKINESLNESKNPKLKSIADKLSKANKDNVVRVIMDFIRGNEDEKTTVAALNKLGGEYSKKNDDGTANDIRDAVDAVKGLNESLNEGKESWPKYLKLLGSYDSNKFNKLDPTKAKFYKEKYKNAADAAEFEQNFLTDLERDINKISLNESKNPTLDVYPSSKSDHKKLKSWLGKSDFHAEEENDYFSFSTSGQSDADNLEIALEKEFVKAGISARFELNESLNESKAELEKLKKEAKQISKDEKCAQHVNQVSKGNYKIEDWYDSEQTVASYENGKQL